MKKVISIVAALAMACVLGACSSPSQSSDASASASASSAASQVSSSASASASSSSASPADEAKQLLKDVSATYDELFTVICAPEYDQLWIDDCKAIVGEEKAAQTAQALKAACTGKIYGEEAIKAYTSAPETTQFDCYFINGVSQLTFDGNKISGTDASGNKLFEHEYEFVKEASLSGMMDGYLYKTSDPDAGEFTYFFMMPDTPASTYHIEFRYGSDPDALTKYNEGAYAYWLAAGIPANRDKQLIENVIGLFVEENLSGASE